MNSPCIEAGTNQDWMAAALDLDGKTRIAGPGVDMGAYEFGGNAGGGGNAVSLGPASQLNGPPPRTSGPMVGG